MNGSRTASVVSAAALVASLAGLGLAGLGGVTPAIAAEAADSTAAQAEESGPTGSGEAASAEQLAQRAEDPWAAQWGLVSGAGDTAAADEEMATYADGIYTGTGLGMDGRITVTLEVKDGIITCTRIEQDGETQSVGGFEAIRDGVFAAMIDEAQGSDIDSIAGATITSSGVRLAVDDALAKAADGVSAAADEASVSAEEVTASASGTNDASATADAANE